MCVVNLVKRLAGISFPVRCYFHSVIMAEGHSPKKCKFEDSSDEDTPQDTLLSNNNCPETITDRADKTDDATFKRLLRRKCIVLLSYCGKGYMGMQWNPGVPTIEDELFQALAKAQAIPDNLKVSPDKLWFDRCARTDRGVSAARQMVPGTELIPRINEHLPDQIRIMGIKRVTKGFNSRQSCTSRVYEYLLPTYAFAPFEMTNLKYRIDATTITRVQKLLNVYLGTHNFHNFTSQKKYEDPSATRYIMSFDVGHPFVRGDVEFISLTVEGQSFMLHQIRKMIGFVIAIMRGCINDDVITEAFNKPKIDIPKAPGLGLLLDSVKYKGYNLKYGNYGLRGMLDWMEYEDDISAFKENHIYKDMIDTEIRELSLLRWMENRLQLNNFYQTRQKLAYEKVKAAMIVTEKESTSDDQTSKPVIDED